MTDGAQEEDHFCNILSRKTRLNHLRTTKIICKISRRIWLRIQKNIFQSKTSLRMGPRSEEEAFELQRTMHRLHSTSFYHCVPNIFQNIDKFILKIEINILQKIYFKMLTNAPSDALHLLHGITLSLLIELAV